MNLIFVSDFVMGVVSIIRMLLFATFTIAGAFMLAQYIAVLPIVLMLLAYIISIALLEIPLVQGVELEEDEE